MCGMCLFWLALAGFECLLENLISNQGNVQKVCHSCTCNCLPMDFFVCLYVCACQIFKVAGFKLFDANDVCRQDI